MSKKQETKPQPAPRELKDEALEKAAGGGRATFKEFTITKKTDSA